MKKTITFLLTIILLVSIIQPALAVSPIIETLSIPKDLTIIQKITAVNGWDKMEAVPQDGNPFEKAVYYVKSTGATSGIRYRTKTMTFEVGGYTGSCSTDALRSRLPAAKETIYDKVTLDRAFFLDILGSGSASALDSEAWLNVGAEIEIYNAGTGKILETITTQDGCDIASKHGFLNSDIIDMKSRWNKVQLRTVTVPDFWPSVPTLQYTGTPGASVTIPAMVYNTGVKNDTTDFLAFWDGESWPDAEAAGRKYNNLTVDQGQKIDTPITVTIPTTAKKLWLRTNVDNNTPANESDLSNNVISVTIGPNTADVGVSISVNTNKPQRDCGVTATVTATNYGPATADVHLVIGENNGTDQVIDYYDEDVYTFTLAPGASKKLTYESGGYSEGHSIYLATKADVTNTTDPYLANNFARTQRITWQAPAPPPVVPPSETNSSLIHTE